MSANIEDLDQTQYHVASGLVLHRMPMSHKKNASFISQYGRLGVGIPFLLILNPLFSLIKNFAFPFKKIH